jgi:hypothetical protein
LFAAKKPDHLEPFEMNDCAEWLNDMAKIGFTVTIVQMENLRYWRCNVGTHTASSNGKPSILAPQRRHPHRQQSHRVRSINSRSSRKTNYHER